MIFTEEYVQLSMFSKTNGKHILKLDAKSFKTLIWYPGFRGLCIQSTNTKKEGNNPTLYPCIYGRDPRTGRRYVKQIHRILRPYVPTGHVVDHIDGDTFNNELRNLEIVTRAENTRRARIKKIKQSNT